MLIFGQGFAITVLYSLVNHRFYWKYGESGFTYNVIGLPLIFMAVWSHYEASRWSGADPGYLKWDHFRTEQELLETEDKMKWENVDYRKKKAR